MGKAFGEEAACTGLKTAENDDDEDENDWERALNECEALGYETPSAAKPSKSASNRFIHRALYPMLF
jgi:hypothetical protein